MSVSRPVIPAMLPPPGSPSQQTVDVLEQRLQLAEIETRQLIDQLGGMGFGKNMTEAERDTEHNIPDTLSPYKARILEKDVLQDGYETLVSRVCKTESAIQTLKLNLLNVRGNKDLQKQVQDEYEEKFNSVKEAYEQEVSKLQRELEVTNEAFKNEKEAKRKAREELKELKTALEDATSTRAQVSAAADDLALGRQKMQKKMQELKEELDREKSLRGSLEESHNTLLCRIGEMETIVEAERNEVKTLTTDCNRLRNESLKMQDDLRQETSRREIAETGYAQSIADNEHLKQNYESVESDRQLLVTELSRLRQQYEELIKQLEQTQIIIDQQKEMLLIDKLALANQAANSKSTNKQLREQNEHLNKLASSSSNERERIKSMHQRELEAEKERLAEKEAVEEEALKLKIKVKDLSSQNDVLKKKVSHLDKELNSLNKKYIAKDEEYSKAADGLEKELSSMKHQLHVIQKEKDRALKDKQNLLDEVNSSVDSMVEERARLQNEIHQAKMELESQHRARRKLEQENANLLERISGLESQQSTQEKVETTMRDMVEQKNKLAYENGRLQTQVTQLTSQLEMLSGAQSEATQLRKINEGLQGRYDVAQKEISDLKITVQRLESRIQQSQFSVENREKQYTDLINARDEAIQQKVQVMSQLQEIEERDKGKVQNLQKNLDDAKSVNKEIASTLEAVMSSHTQLQNVVESLQVDLGKKDTQIAQLKTDKNKEQEEWKQEMRAFEDRMESLREELNKERQKSYKKTSKDIAEIKKQNDELSNRNMDLVRTNTEQRHKLQEAEQKIDDLKEKASEQKRKMDYLHRSKKDLEDSSDKVKVSKPGLQSEHRSKKDLEDSSDKVKKMRNEIEELERVRDEYIKRNREQGEMINNFMDQISSLQTELRQLAECQNKTKELIKQKDIAVEKERKIRDEVKRKYKDTRRREEHVERMKREAELRLQEAQNESTEISGHLKDAHDWFQTKFNKLQHELQSSRKAQAQLEYENSSQKKQLEMERMKAQAAAEKAKEMIKSSRQTIGRLSDFAEIADLETKHQIAQLHKKLQKERDHAKYLEMKHKSYKEASTRHLADILKEYSS